MLPKNVQNLIDEFSKLPGIGPKSAARLTFYLLSKPKYEVESLGRSVLDIAENLHYCSECFNICEDTVCNICSDDRRDHTIITVAEEPLDVIALERSMGFVGVYHVLGGVISPINGIGPEDLRVSQLIDRLRGGEVSEVILATNPNLEGEATAVYIKNKISELGLEIKVSRIARGLPIGGDLDYADEVTLKRSLEGRISY